MKTLTPEQRIEGFTELEGVIGEGGVGGAHLASFLAGIAHAEKVIGEEQDDEPVAWTSQDDLNTMGSDAPCYMYPRPMAGDIPLYLHPAPRKPFVRLTDQEIMIIVDQEIMTIVRADGEFDEMMLDKAAVRFVRTIENALAEKSGWRT